MAFATPIDFTAIENALVTWLRSSTGLPVVWSNQDRPQTARPYALLKMTAGPIVIGRDEQRRRMEGPVLFTDIIGQRALTFSVQVFSSSDKPTEHAQSYLAIAMAALERDETIDLFNVAKMSVSQIGPVSDLDSVAGAGFESRAAFDLNVYTVSALIPAVDQPTNWIETADVSEAA